MKRVYDKAKEDSKYKAVVCDLELIATRFSTWHQGLPRRSCHEEQGNEAADHEGVSRLPDRTALPHPDHRKEAVEEGHSLEERPSAYSSTEAAT